jgi:cation diffusion facilitator CzcD-associated flavoprotein CzcO
MKDDVSLEELKGKRVVVFGCGSSASDNATLAVLAGAAEVTMVYRHQRIFLSSHASYLMTSLQSEQAD